MATRLFMISLLLTAISCRGSSKGDDESSMASGKRATAVAGRDAVENAMLNLGIDGRVYRFDLNGAKLKAGRMRVRQAHLLSDLLLLEGSADEPRVFALKRDGLEFRWTSSLKEPTRFHAAENQDSVLLLSMHYLHALEKRGGLPSMMFVGGALDGVRKPVLRLPFTPTGAPAAQSDTVYIPSLGSHDSNKTLESFSLINGSRGWGNRTSSDIFTSLKVGGSSGDPKLYFVTRTGHLSCMDAVNYGYLPRGARWEKLLEAPVSHDFALTSDSKGAVGGLFVVDDEGMVYCIDRITGNRRWTNATGRRPAGAPQVFGNLCVVPMTSGLCAFHAGNVVYRLDDAAGNTVDYVADDYTPDKIGGVTFEVQNEVLHVIGDDDNQVSVNGGAATGRATVVAGDVVSVGGKLIRIHDRGTEPVWVDKKFDRIVGRIGMKLIAQKGNTLQLIDVWSAAREGDAIDFSAARIIPSNTSDANLFVIGGDAVVYALFAR